MIINPTFEMPLRKFKGKDLIIWGNETALLEGDGRNGTDLSSPLSASCINPCKGCACMLTDAKGSRSHLGCNTKVLLFLCSL